MKLLTHLVLILVLLWTSLQINRVDGLIFKGLHKRAIAPIRSTIKRSPDTSGRILNHGGPVISNPIVYVIWYGDWTDSSAVDIIESFLEGLGATSWWSMTKAYNNSANLIFGNSTTDSYSQGTRLTEAKIQAIVNDSVNSGKLPDDKNGIYLVLTSADVSEGSFCSSYCGYHSHISSRKYAFVGNPAKCLKSCAAQSSKSPNNNVGADGMASVIAHELTEAVTDPSLNAWYDASGNENADKCAWTFGSTRTASNGASYNMVVNGKKYLVQQNWKYPAQTCGMS